MLMGSVDYRAIVDTTSTTGGSTTVGGHHGRDLILLPCTRACSTQDRVPEVGAEESRSVDVVVKYLRDDWWRKRAGQDLELEILPFIANGKYIQHCSPAGQSWRGGRSLSTLQLYYFGVPFKSVGYLVINI